MSRTIRANVITLEGETVISGNLTVSGTTTEVETTNTSISDNIITLNKGETGPGIAGGTGYSGIEVDRGTGQFVPAIRYNDNTDSWELSNNGVTFLNISATSGGSGIENVVEDTTPQLGGNLDVNGQTITSASNGDITISPDGTGKLILNTYVRMENVASAPSMSAGYATIYADTVAGGGSGVYVSNSEGQTELVTKTKAIVYGLIF